MNPKKPSLADRLKGLGSVDDQIARKMKGLQPTPAGDDDSVSERTDALSALQSLKDNLDAKLRLMEDIEQRAARPQIQPVSEPEPYEEYTAEYEEEPVTPPPSYEEPEPEWEESSYKSDLSNVDIRDPEPEVLPPRPVSSTTKTVLLIDDSPRDQSIISDLLAREDIDLMTASTGKEGISRAISRDIDMVMVDISLPDINGLEVCKRIKGHYNSRLLHTRLVVLSDKDDLSDITEAFSAGADDYIIKNLRPAFLVKKIRSYLGLH